MYHYNYNYGGLESSSDFGSFLSGASIAVVILVVLGILIACAVGIFLIIAYCKLFKKAGQKWWKGLVPVYNTWIETKITGLAWWWFPITCGLGALVSQNCSENAIVLWAFFLTYFNYNFNLAKKFGKSNGFAVLLSLLPVIGLPILAFGSAQYNKSADVDQNGIFSIKK